MKITRIIVLCLLVLLTLSACSPLVQETPTETPKQTPLKTETLSPETSVGSEDTLPPTTFENQTLEPFQTPSPTPTLIEPVNPEYDNAYGPFVFAEKSYKIAIDQKNVTFYNTDDKSVYYKFENMMIEENEKELFLLSASFIDLNFDVVPDFFYKKADGTAMCYLGKNTAEGGVEYIFNGELSTLYDLSRCYETRELYARTEKDSSVYYTIKISEDGYITDKTPLTEAFSWDITSISDAITGGAIQAQPGDKVTIRSVLCSTYTLGGFITIAFDDYGNFYIKDMPHRGFCRLALNPNGRWSKSEKVMADTPLAEQ